MRIDFLCLCVSSKQPFYSFVPCLWVNSFQRLHFYGCELFFFCGFRAEWSGCDAAELFPDGNRYEQARCYVRKLSVGLHRTRLSGISRLSRCRSSHLESVPRHGRGLGAILLFRMRPFNGPVSCTERCGHASFFCTFSRHHVYLFAHAPAFVRSTVGTFRVQ